MNISMKMVAETLLCHSLCEELMKLNKTVDNNVLKACLHRSFIKRIGCLSISTVLASIRWECEGSFCKKRSKRKMHC